MSSLIDAPLISGRLPDDGPTARIIHFDATQPRKERMRQAATGGKSLAVSRVPAGSPPAVEPSLPPISPATEVLAQPVMPESRSAVAASDASAGRTANTGLSRSDLEQVLIDFVVEQTGYPAEMVELDADLEADLGIDSIKKAQLFGELAEQFGIQPPADVSEFSLDDFSTLGHVANFLEQAAGENPEQAVGGNGMVETLVAHNPTVVETLVPSPPLSTGNGSVTQPAASQPVTNAADLEIFLVNFVVEQTGYPAEMVELDADLEADLGIDSIKKAQLFGELAEQFGIQSPADTTEFSLDDFPTLRHVVGFLQNASAETTSAPAASTVSSTEAAATGHAAVNLSEPAGSESSTDNNLETFLINFVVEQTGYPAEMVELDADLEADLGIDSIKKAQLFGELAEYFEIQVTEDLSLDDFSTLGHVRDFLRNVPRRTTV